MIKKVIQIADVHIPNNCNDHPYDEMLEKLYLSIDNEIGNMNREEVRIVVVGDIFHLKIKASNEAKTMFHNMLNYFNKTAKTIIIAGNHDMLENNTDRTDSITPTFEIDGAYPNIVYLDKALGYKSGCYTDDNIIWSLYSMFDNFVAPSFDGIKKQNKTIIGLYHGDIPGSVTDTNFSSENGINCDIFSKCNIVLCGHIHKYQVIEKNKIKFVYSSSVFQQNFGETTTNHGYVVWNIDTLEHKLIEVENKYKLYKFRITNYDDVKNNTEQLINL